MNCLSLPVIIYTNLVIFVCFVQDFPLGGWSVERSVDGEPPVIYKFTPKYVLKTGSYVTVSPLIFKGQ